MFVVCRVADMRLSRFDNDAPLCRGPLARLRPLFVTLLLLPLLANSPGMPLRSALRTAVTTEEEEDGHESVKTEIKLGLRASADGPASSRRRDGSSRLSLAALRHLTCHTHTATTFVAPLWEHAYRHGIGAPLRC